MTGALRLATAAAVIAAWCGAAVIVASTVAPAAFEVLPSRALAGTVVGRVLPTVFYAGIGAGVVAAVLVWRTSVWAGVLAVVLAACCAGAQFVLTPRIARLRAQLGPALDALPAGDPQRLEFGRLHGFSVGLMGLAVLAGLVLLIISLRTLAQRS